MSTSSIARQNRRKRQRQQPSLPHLSTPEPSSSSNPYVLDPMSYMQSLNYESDHPDAACRNDPGSKIDSEAGKSPVPTSTGCSFIHYDISSHPVGKIFIEDERGFRAVDASHITFQSLDSETLQSEQAIDLAYKAAKYFHTFSFTCHGLLGGLAFFEILLLIHLISMPFAPEESLKHFRFLSQPIHNLFNIFCIICCISAFDRYDIGNLKQLFAYARKYKLNIIIIVIYPTCFLLSLSTANVDEKLCVPQMNSSDWESFWLEDTESELFYWKSVSISKCTGAVIAWIIMSLGSNQNLLLYHLKDILQRNCITTK